jgi:hypothetical protein
MSSPPRSSPWRIPLVRELAIILLLKLAILLAIKAVWFSEPAVPEHGSEQVGNHLLGNTGQLPLSLNEEKPR